MTSGAQLYDVLRRIRPVHELSARAVTEALVERDVSMPMRAVLERLHDAGPQTVPAVARWLHVSRQGVQALVDRAKALGYVETRPNPTHRRSHLVALTARGESVFTAIHAGELATLDQLADGLDPGDVDACVRVLDHLVRELDATVQAPSTERNLP